MTLPANLPSSCCEGPSSYWRRGQREVLTTVDMITRCSNPNCHRELRYLRGGRVVRVIRKTGGVPEIEHFWLWRKLSQIVGVLFSSGLTRPLQRQAEACERRRRSGSRRWLFRRPTFGNVCTLMESR
jgi:hypothetical protein